MFTPFFRHSLRGTLILCGIVALNACQNTYEVKEPDPPATDSGKSAMHYEQLTDYGDPGLARFARKMADRAVQKVHIVQLGDSHTAADFFTGALRATLQEHYGDGGVGFISPLGVQGNRNSNVVFDKSPAWRLITSRKDSDPAFTFGGTIATPEQAKASAQFTLRNTSSQTQARLLYRSTQPVDLTVNRYTLHLENSEGSWRFSPPLDVTSPVQFSLSRPDIQLGGWLLTHPGGGVMVSASGLNGAQISMPDKWQAEWPDVLNQLKPDMVILSFGTNEAYNSALNLEQYRASLQRQVQTLRRAMPDTAILLMAPGSSIQNGRAKSCKARQPALLPEIVAIQRQVAEQEHTLFWDWYAYMGGECGWEIWSAQGLVRDKVHLTLPGYQRAAAAFWQQLSSLLDKETL